MIPDDVRRPGGRLAVWTGTGVAGTVFIAAAAFWLSFTALADLARRSGVDVNQTWAWALTIDGIIVVATVAPHGQHAAWYPWVLLVAGTVVSVTANAIHAVVGDADVSGALARAVAAVPPLVLLAITHLTVVLTCRFRSPAASTTEVASDLSTVRAPEVPRTDDAAHLSTKELALQMKDDGMTNKTIARATGVHPSTVGRWLATPAGAGASHQKGGPL